MPNAHSYGNALSVLDFRFLIAQNLINPNIPSFALKSPVHGYIGRQLSSGEILKLLAGVSEAHTKDFTVIQEAPLSAKLNQTYYDEGKLKILFEGIHVESGLSLLMVDIDLTQLQSALFHLWQMKAYCRSAEIQFQGVVTKALPDLEASNSIHSLLQSYLRICLDSQDFKFSLVYSINKKNREKDLRGFIPAGVIHYATSSTW